MDSLPLESLDTCEKYRSCIPDFCIQSTFILQYILPRKLSKNMQELTCNIKLNMKYKCDKNVCKIVWPVHNELLIINHSLILIKHRY